MNNKGNSKLFDALAFALELGFVIAIPIGGFIFLGFLADGFLETYPLFLIGGNVIGLGVLCNRGGITPHDVADVPKLISLVEVKLEAWDEEDCPLCKQSVPINTDVGKGREFLARKQG